MRGPQEILVVCICFVFAAVPLAAISLNEAQILGTHNSYHIASNPTLPAWNYSFPNVTYQLDCLGIRKFEFDFWYDDGKWSVYHIAEYDNRSNCNSLQACLLPLAQWSSAHQTHFPIVINLEPKDAFNATIWDAYEALISSIFGLPNLITPDSLTIAGALAPSIASTGWPDVDAIRGKFLITIDSKYDEYLINNTLDGRTSFINCNYQDFQQAKPNCVYFTFENLDDPVIAANVQEIVNAGYLVRARADSNYYPGNVTEEQVLTASFQVMDTDASGSLSFPEFENFILQTTGITLGPTEAAGIQSVMAICPNMDLNKYVNCFIPILKDQVNLTAVLIPIPTDTAAIVTRDAALASGAFVIDSDYVERKPFTDYIVALAGGNPVRCNSIVIAAACTSDTLESGLWTCRPSSSSNGGSGSKTNSNNGADSSASTLSSFLSLLL